MEIKEKLQNDLNDAKKELASFKENKTCSYELVESEYDYICTVCDETINAGDNAYCIEYIDEVYVCENNMEYYLIEKVGNIALRLEMLKDINTEVSDQTNKEVEEYNKKYEVN